MKCSKRQIIKLIVICTAFAILLLSSILVLITKNRDNNQNSSVGRVRLNIETYIAGKDQPTHPSVIGFRSKWNGYKYWLAYTPYPFANGEEENPSIACSNDLMKWETPYGMVNPIADNEETGCTELKDCHILFREDLDRLEVWYLGRVSEDLGGDGTTLTLFRKYSADGVIWSDYEIMSSTFGVSPSLIWTGDRYQMWIIDSSYDNSTGCLVYSESLDGKEWTTPKECSINGQTKMLKIWHGTVCFNPEDDLYYFVYIEDSTDSQTIEACQSQDGIHYDINRTVISNDKTTLWQQFYKPCLLVEQDEYHLFYGVVTSENKWYISYSKGPSLFELKGIDNNDIPQMKTLKSTVTDTNRFNYKVKSLYHSIQNHFRIELLVLVFAVIVVEMFIKRKRKWLLLLCSILICIVYSWMLFRPVKTQAILAIVITSGIEGITVFSIGGAVAQLFSKLKNKSS